MKNIYRQKPLLKFLRIYKKATAISFVPFLVAVFGYFFQEKKLEGDPMAEVTRRIER